MLKLLSSVSQFLFVSSVEANTKVHFLQMNLLLYGGIRATVFCFILVAPVSLCVVSIVLR